MWQHALKIRKHPYTDFAPTIVWYREIPSLSAIGIVIV